MKKLRAKQIRNHILRKLINPKHVFKMVRMSRKRTKQSRASNDAQLKLYAKVLQGGFLHYGYFQDTSVSPESISLQDFFNAQKRYAEHLLKHLTSSQHPVLDVGCGLGGLMHMMKNQGHHVIGLTPDRYQIEYINKTYPDYKLIHGKMERIDVEAYQEHFGTVINAESFQYIKLQKGLQIINSILKPGGRWIISDYFRINKAHEKSGHMWEDFLQEIQKYDMRITNEQDITENIRPTLDFFHMWGNRFGLPLYEFLTEKLERKNAALNYLLEEVLNDTRSFIEDHIKLIEPDQFMRDKKYMILVIEKSTESVY